MCLRLLHKKYREISFTNFLKLNSDGCHVEQVGISMARVPEILRLDIVVGHSETQVTSNVEQLLIAGKAERCTLLAHPTCQSP